MTTLFRVEHPTSGIVGWRSPFFSVFPNILEVEGK